MSSTQSFEEQSFVLLRRHGAALIYPVVFLFLDGALFFFVDSKLTEIWQHQVLLGLVLLIGLLLWFIPSLKFFTNRYELTSTRVVAHSGLFGTKTEEAAWGEVTGVSISRGVSLDKTWFWLACQKPKSFLKKSSNSLRRDLELKA